MGSESDLSELAERQHGLLSVRQLRAAGLSDAAIRHRRRSGRLVRLSPRVLKIAGSADTPAQRAMSATLDVSGAAVALWSAAALWGLPGFELEPVHVLTSRVPHRGSPRLGVLHSAVRLHEGHLALVDGIPVTTPVRTLVDLARRIHPGRLERLCDTMWARRLLDGHVLGRTVEELAVPGARGAVVLRALAEARPPSFRPPESNTERRVNELLTEAGQRPLERQVDVGDHMWIGRVDLLDRGRRLIVEVQSDLFHGSLVDQRHDAERLARLRAAGWTVLEVSEHEVCIARRSSSSASRAPVVAVSTRPDPPGHVHARPRT